MTAVKPNLEIRRIAPEDLGAIAAIQAASRESADWPPAAYLDYETWIAIRLPDGAPAGFLAMRTVAPEEHELLNLAVAPELRRIGIASELLRHAMRQAPGLWFLEVRESNLAAQNLYKSFGFNISGKRKRYYREPDEDAIVLSHRS